jgi:hypothetical protein
MSTENPLGSNVPPERPVNPSHFGGAGLYDSDDPLQTVTTTQPTQDQQDSKRSLVPALLAIGGVAWLLTVLVRRATQ